LEVAPVRIGAEHRVPKQDDDAGIRVVGADALESAGPVDVGGRDLAGVRPVGIELALERGVPVPWCAAVEAAVLVEVVEFLPARGQLDGGMQAEQAVEARRAALLHTDDEEIELPRTASRARAAPAERDQVAEGVVEGHATMSRS